MIRAAVYMTADNIEREEDMTMMCSMLKLKVNTNQLVKVTR